MESKLATLAFVILSALGVRAQEADPVLSTQKISSVFGGPPNPVLEVSDQFGRAAAAIGDVDGDGVEDIAVGAQGDDTAPPGIDPTDGNYGSVRIVFLKSNGKVKGLQKINAVEGGFTGVLTELNEFGAAVTGLGDFDGDGVPDIVVGSRRDGDGGTGRGAIWLLFLNSDGTVKSHQKISSTQGGFTGQLENLDEFGRGIALLGDLDGDGTDDLAVAATNDNDGRVGRGAFWVLFLNPDGTVKAHQKVSDEAGGMQGQLEGIVSFATSIASLGDLDGDGVTDIAVGTVGDNTGGRQAGSCYLCFMRTDGTVKSFRKIDAGTEGFEGQLEYQDQFGFSVTGLGDYDDDGVSDVAVGCALDDDGGDEIGTNKGAIYLFLLSPDGSIKSFQKISSTEGGFTGTLSKNDWFGVASTALDDLDGNGAPDLVVGARFDDDGGADKGAVWVLFLSGLDAPTADFIPAPYSGPAPLTVQFNDTSTGTLAQWSWSFGDGGTSTLQNPSHTYALQGTYTVELEVSGSDGSSTKRKEDLIAATDGSAQAIVYGSGLNPAGSLTVISGLPRIGTSIVLGLDNPLGTQAAGSIATLYLAFEPDPSFPDGSLLAGFSMFGAQLQGELLINRVPPDPFRSVTGEVWQGPGNPVEIAIDVPTSLSFVGLSVYGQGLMADPVAAAGVRLGLTQAIEMRIGP